MTTAPHAHTVAAPAQTVGWLASDFDYDLPPELIADQPAAQRDQSRLLIVGGASASSGSSELVDAHFRALPDLIAQQVGPRSLIVLNDTKVLPARLFGYKLRSDGERGGQVEFLLTEPLPAGPGKTLRWRAMYRTSKPLRADQVVRLEPRKSRPPGAAAPATHDVRVLSAEAGDAQLDLGVLDAAAFSQLLSDLGELPLPPYIERARDRLGHRPPDAEDRVRYQTVFARIDGSVAAPTAGLHFTPELLAQLRDAGHQIAYITLHVGPGTFMPLRSDRIVDHVMHGERYQISRETADAIAAAHREGRKIVAVGTTVVRTLEAAALAAERASRDGDAVVQPVDGGQTQLFIYPPYRFRIVDAMVTNFHLPRSTLLMLVSAFAGRLRTLAAYRHAVAQRYRFYSFGDAMLIPCRQPDDDLPPHRPVAPTSL